MRSFPIWNQVEACIYKSSKSFGAKNTSGITVKVGSGRGNSHELCHLVTTKRDVKSIRYPGEMVRVYSTSWNGIVLSRMWFRYNKNGTLHPEPYRTKHKRGLKSIPSEDR